MSLRPADRALRKLVAELAALHADDVEAILAELSDGQRARVKALLAEYRGAGLQPSAATAAAQGPDAIEGLSHWLAARIRAAAGDGDGLASPQFGMPAFAMTDAGRAALLAAAAKARAAHPAAPTVRKPAEASTSLSGFLSLLRGGRR